MKWKYIIGALLIGGTAAAAYFISKYVSRQKALLEDYGLEFLGIKFSSFTENLITVEFTMRVHNKSDVEATVQSVYADIFLNNNPVGNIVNNGQFVIAAKGYSDIKLNLSFASKEVLKNIVSALLNLAKVQDIPYKLKGYVKIKSGFVGFSLPFEYNGSVKSDLLG